MTSRRSTSSSSIASSTGCTHSHPVAPQSSPTEYNIGRTLLNTPTTSTTAVAVASTALTNASSSSYNIGNNNNNNNNNRKGIVVNNNNNNGYGIVSLNQQAQQHHAPDDEADGLPRIEPQPQLQHDVVDKMDHKHDEEQSSLKSKHMLYNRPSWFIIQVTCIASLGGILFGYDLGIISGTLPQLTIQFNLSDQQKELVVSILYVGGTMGATVGGTICDLFGRKKAIVVCDFIFILGALLLFYANSITTILIGRVIVGFGIALSGIADVTYLHEIAPAQFRGAIVSVNEACIALGFLLAFGISVIPSLSLKNIDASGVEGWRIMFGVSGIVALLQLIGMLYLPESPKWLSDRNSLKSSLDNSGPDHHQRKNSRTLLIQMSSASAATIEMDRTMNNGSPIPTTTTTISTNYQSIASPGRSGDTDVAATVHDHDDDNNKNATLDSINKKSTSSATEQTSFRLFRTYCYPIVALFHFLCSSFCTFMKTIVSTNLRRQTYITLFLATTQQFCGQTNVLSYAPLIFTAASNSNSNSVDSSMQEYATVSIGIVKFIVTVLVIWKIESIGRRTLLLYGIGTIAVGLFLLAIAFAGTIVVQPDDAGAATSNGGEQQAQQSIVTNTYSGFYFAVPGVLLVVCGYSMSYGPLTWLITSELYPTDIRGRALGVSTIVTYVCAAIVTYTFLSASALVGSSILFSFYLLVTCLAFIFALLAIPDTGGRNSDGIETALGHMVWWQHDRRQERSWNDYVPTSMKQRHITLSTSDRDISSQFVVETEIT